MKLEVFYPTGSPVEASSLPHAPRLADLKGKTIGEVSNGMWEDSRTFPLIRKLLKQRFPDIRFVPYTDMPAGVHEIDIDQIGEMVAAKGCHAVIGGNSA
ncbi:MAG: hypothetical protein HYY32_01440 [Chloroflexi bacterium]|nr:hypothetical protein [Chloroflexota bacterium]